MKYPKLSFTFRDFFKIVAWKGFWIFALKYWKVGLYELARSYSKNMFIKSLQDLVPIIKNEDIEIAGAGIRAQILTNEGKLFDDFLIESDGNITYIVNAPSPAATSSLAIAESIIKKL
jgi:L-2-hydroxyglutarate oxidase